MEKIFGSLAILLVLLTGWIVHKNRLAYEGQIEKRVDQEQELDRQLGKKGEEEQLKKERTQELADARDLLAQTETELANKEEERENLKQEVAQKTRDKEPLEQELKEIEDMMASLPRPDVLIPKIQKLKSNIALLNDEIDVAESKLANLVQGGKDTDGVIEDFIELVDNQTKLRSQPYLTTKLSAVYQQWGFVTLSSGDLQGVVPNSRLDVMRDGEVIAKLKVSAVEPNSAAADIVRDSIAHGFILIPGDQVVPEALDEPAQGEETTTMLVR